LKIKDENFELKSENLIKQQSLEKSALQQKMNSEHDDMLKIKQIEIDKIVAKYKNKKFELETKQGKEKNLHENENLLKANIFNSNLINNNITNFENSVSINKSMNKPSVNRFNSMAETKLREIAAPYSKRINNISNNDLNNDKKKVSKGNFSTNFNNSNDSDKQMEKTTKSQKMFNNGAVGSLIKKPASIKNLQYSSAQN